MNPSWFDVIICGILLGQGLSHIRPTINLGLQCLFGILPSSLGLSHGIRDFVLFTHACVGLGFQRAPLPILLCLDRMIGEPVMTDVVGSAIPIILILVGISIIIEAALSFDSTWYLAQFVLSLFLLLVSFDRLLNRYKQHRATPRHDTGTSTDEPPAPILSVLTDVCCIVHSPRATLETPTHKSTVLLSPRAETTPSEVPRTPWQAESSTSEADQQEYEWYYLDLSGQIQGPFGSDLMLSWYEKGFLQDDLRVSTQKGDVSAFAPIQHLKRVYGGQIPFHI